MIVRRSCCVLQGLVLISLACNSNVVGFSSSPSTGSIVANDRQYRHHTRASRRHTASGFNIRRYHQASSLFRNKNHDKTSKNDCQTRLLSSFWEENNEKIKTFVNNNMNDSDGNKEDGNAGTNNNMPNTPTHPSSDTFHDQENISMLVMTVLPSIVAFFLWEDISVLFAHLFDKFAGFPNVQGQNVDGNAFATNLLRPTINGVVVPATSIALGTLFATTVNVLWERQLKMRSCINKEVGELRLLRRALFGCFGTAQHSRRRATALGLLHGYTNSLVLETQTSSIARLESIQRNGGISMNEADGKSYETDAKQNQR